MKNSNLAEIVEEKKLDINKLRINIGSGNIRYSNCINLDLENHSKVDIDITGDVTRGLPFSDNTFVEILFLHVIEHIQRKFHTYVFNEIWRILKPDGRLILGFPDFMETAKRFIENRFAGRWKYYNATIYGRQAYKGDYHVTAMERQDVTDRLLSSGFVNIKYLQNGINVTMTAYKGKELNYL